MTPEQPGAARMPPEEGSTRATSVARRRLTAPLAGRVEDDSRSDQVAAACGALWLELDAALSPIIGMRGVSALGQRSWHLACAVHPWLAEQRRTGPAPFDAALLVSLLAQCSSDDAAAAADTFLQTLRELLVSLIGIALTQRLLGVAWVSPAPSLNRPSAQDPNP